MHFLENDDYKILNNNEFDINKFCSPIIGEQNQDEEKRGAHNKQYVIVSPDCFKELCYACRNKKIKRNKKILYIYFFLIRILSGKFIHLLMNHHTINKYLLVKY